MKRLPAGIINSQSNRPAAAIAILFSLGIALSQVCREYLFCGFALSGLALLGAALLALRRRRIALSFVLGNVAIAIAGLLMALAHRDGIPDRHLRLLLSHSAFQLDEPVLFEGCVAEEIERRGNEYVTTVDLHGFLRKGKWTACQGKGMLGIARTDSENAPPPCENLMMGDRVRGWAVWRIPRNYQNPGSADRAGQLARRGVFLIGRAKSPRLLESIQGDCSNPVIAASNYIRNHVRRSFQSINPEGNSQSAAILESLVIGDYSGLNNSTRELFQNSGAFHVLVVSGLHVAWIAGVLMFIFRTIRIPERISYLLATLAIIYYATVIGFQASITRCLWMFVFYLAGRMLIRRADSVNVLFTSALLILAAQPDWLFEIGFQLSFLSVMAIAMTAAPAVERYLQPLLDPLRHSGRSSPLFLQPGLWPRTGRNLRMKCELLVEGMTDASFPAAAGALMCALRFIAGTALAGGGMLLISFSVQIWIEPLLAYYFNRISWISPLANLAIVPFSSIVLSAGIISSTVMNVPLLGTNLIQFAGWLAAQLLRGAGLITIIDGAWQRCPTPSIIWVGAGIMLVFAWSFFEWRRFWIPCLYIVILLAFVSCGWHPAQGGKKAGDGRNPPLKITFLDVGNGDSAIISFPNGENWVIDAGGLRQAQSGEESSHALDIGEAVVSRYLWTEWITKLDRLILSHSDIDHAGGVLALIKNFHIKRLDSSQKNNDAIMNAILKAARKKKLGLNILHSGMEERVGEATIRIFNPPAESVPASTNDSSIVLHISYKSFSALFTGDLEKTGEAEVLDRPWDMSSLLLKVAHHGSRSGTSDRLLDRTRPRWAVLSVGRYNQFGHPSRDVVARLLRHGAHPILTFDQGAITFETDGFVYAVRSYVSGVISRQMPADRH
jgi:competence protein ComEC